WLNYGHGIFWVSGRAGSGKSTLMKFIADDRRTRKSLEKWAEPNKLAIAAHYFWSAGTDMQKSQQGLLQTLLYDMFRACPEQISRVCPLRWSNLSLLDSATTNEWSTHELMEAIQELGQHPSSPRHCIFIDGLDEFDGDHSEMCQALKRLSVSPNFKFCVSSRPWNDFEDAFGSNHSQKLRIHDLTHNNILVYTQDRLLEHPRWDERYFQGEQMESLVDGITNRAHSVFLWVFLVTRSLKKGLTDGSSMKYLEAKLRSFPDDLGPFFKHMLQLIDPLYHRYMARTLRVATNAHEALNVLIYRGLENEEEDENYVLNQTAGSFESDGSNFMFDQWCCRMNARCGGLLEVKQDRVEFLDRTVRDFLLTKDMDDFLLQRSGPDFMLNLSTLKGFVFMLK
ncbi:hypothetical protein M426DRAFT_41528, partial [Hypoxylon sp. CI-4A]